MAPAHKGKGKGREARPSRSRNTTPSSGLSSGPTVTVPIHSTSYLENDPSKLLIPSSQYAEVLDRMGGAGPIPDSKSLESLVDHLKSLSQMADARGDVCNLGIRELSQKRKEVSDEPEPIDRDAMRLKREMDEDDDALQPSKGSKGGKLKKRKERGGSAKEDHPLAHGAHEVSRQDGAETKVEGAASPASKKSKNAASEGNSPLSHSPSSPNNATGANVTEAQAAESPGSEESDDSHQPDPAPTVPQVQVFGSNPLKFDDPTIYHIREVTPDMTDEDKKEIYSVAVFPRSDLRDKMAGTPPDKDFSNAKPANQVSANTFQAYIEPFVRPLMEEDIAWLKEKGDRVTPFIMPPRGKKHFKEIWSEEDGALGLDKSNDERLPLNQGRGTIEQITDESAETDQVSVGPMVSRLYSLLRYEHRAPAEEGSATNGTLNGEGSANGGGAGAGAGAGGGASSLNGDSMEIDQPLPETTDSKPPLPSATAFPDASPTGFKVPAARLDHSQLDERLKAELRHVGFIGQDDNPDYDAHYDDDIAQRLRLLQSELKKQILTNNARKARLLDIARERMAYQEYTTIHDDLDTQVQQAYLKRSRTLGKSKKGSQAKNRPGAAGGAGAAGANHVAASVSRPAIGDVARTLMDRRKRWEDCIGPVFRDCKTTVPGNGETIFDPGVMAEYEKTEVEDDDQE